MGKALGRKGYTVMSTEQDIREKLKDIRVGYLIDESQWTFNTDELVNMILSHGNQRELEVLKRLTKQSIHYTPDGLVADGLDTWAVPQGVIDAELKQKQEKP